jgi:hypothetical protein
MAGFQVIIYGRFWVFTEYPSLAVRGSYTEAPSDNDQRATAVW